MSSTWWSGWRRPGKDKKVVEQALTLYDSRAYSVDEISKTTGISRATLYKYINLRKEKKSE
ncbi:MAG: helix-turn-helix domain-containing protein [Candidatus Cryptobacteroides sp.]